MRTSRHCLLIAALLAGLAAAPARAADYGSAVEAYNQGIAALKSHDFDKAAEDLTYAADQGVFLAGYYLARLYGTKTSPLLDHPRAYELLRQLVDKNRNVDPYADFRAPFVARAELALAFYLQGGIDGVEADPDQARSYLEHAALVLLDTDAQALLARTHLREGHIGRGLDLLERLVLERTYAPAAAQLADFYMTGRFVGESHPEVALAYATRALEDASSEDRIWIADLYQTMFCKASPRQRLIARQLVKQMRRQTAAIGGGRQLVLTPAQNGPGVLDLGQAGATRVCGNGEVVDEPVPLPPAVQGSASTPAILSPGESATGSAGASGATNEAGIAVPAPKPVAQGYGEGSATDSVAMGIGLKDLETPQLLDAATGEPAADAEDATQ